jgi:hypothetical protein
VFECRFCPILSLFVNEKIRIILYTDLGSKVFLRRLPNQRGIPAIRRPELILPTVAEQYNSKYTPIFRNGLSSRVVTERFNFPHAEYYFLLDIIYMEVLHLRNITYRSNFVLIRQMIIALACDSVHIMFCGFSQTYIWHIHDTINTIKPKINQ